MRTPHHRFLSTLSLRRATAPPYNAIIHQKNFYPRSPCGERRFNPFETLIVLAFLSTLSLRRATNGCNPDFEGKLISIHALLAESDSVSGVINNVINNFYPRSPCGERPPPAPQGESSKKFLSTLSLRRATPTQTKQTEVHTIFLSTLSLRRAT